MRKVNIGTSNFTAVFANDDPEFGESYSYEIDGITETDNTPASCFATIKFQKGPIKEHGVNGCHNEDLIAITIDRLQGLNQGDFRCRENSTAITKLEEAMMWLNKRTQDRINRGVEGTHKK